jgi:hypothetical protein
MSSLSPISTGPTVGEPVRAKTLAATARVVTILLGIAVPLMIAAICWRWATVHEPTAAVVIAGDPSLEGATIVVSGRRHEWTVGLDPNNAWQTPVLLDPGEYHIAATHHGRIILNEAFRLDRLRGIRFDLPSMVLIVGGNILADAKIEIVRESGRPEEFAPTEVKLSSLDHYKTPIYLFPGTYRAIARRVGAPDRVLAQVEFIVDRTKIIRVDLARAASEGSD